MKNFYLEKSTRNILWVVFESCSSVEAIFFSSKKTKKYKLNQFLFLLLISILKKEFGSTFWMRNYGKTTSLVHR